MIKSLNSTKDNHPNFIHTTNKLTNYTVYSFKTLRLKKEISGQLQVESQTSFLIFQIHFCDGTKFNKEAGDVKKKKK